MNKYVFKPYCEIFPQLFAKEKERILLHSKSTLQIEHIGSTSIPHLGGKGIIDIAIASPKEQWETISQELQELGYEYRPAFSTADRCYFVIDLPDPKEDTRRYHVHLTYSNSQDWQGFLACRDYLRIHPKDAQEYAAIKKQAAAKANHVGAQYRKIKEPTLQKILAKAKQESHGDPKPTP